MLKIKDEVDLKELEKFGFRKSGGVYQIDLAIRKANKQEIFGFINACIYITEEDRIIRISALETIEIQKLDIIYDLIQEGIVEKVSDR